MDLQQAKELVKFDFDNHNIILVTSNKAIFFLNNESEISNVEEYAKSNKLELFIVKKEASKDEATKKKK